MTNRSNETDKGQPVDASSTRSSSWLPNLKGRRFEAVMAFASIVALVLSLQANTTSEESKEIASESLTLTQIWRDEENSGSVSVRVSEAVDYAFPTSKPEEPDVCAAATPVRTVVTLDLYNPGVTTIRDVWLIVPKGSSPGMLGHKVVQLEDGRFALWLQNIGAGATVQQDISFTLTPNEGGEYTAFTDYAALEVIYTDSDKRVWATGVEGSVDPVGADDPRALIGEQGTYYSIPTLDTEPDPGSTQAEQCHV